jgi:hypothetical protein
MSQPARQVLWGSLFVFLFSVCGLMMMSLIVMVTPAVSMQAAPSPTPNCSYGGDSGDATIFETCLRSKQLETVTAIQQQALRGCGGASAECEFQIAEATASAAGSQPLRARP